MFASAEVSQVSNVVVTILLPANTALLLGLAYKWGQQAQRLERAEKDIAEMKEKQDSHSELISQGRTHIDLFKQALDAYRIELESFRKLFLRAAAAHSGQ